MHVSHRKLQEMQLIWVHCSTSEISTEEIHFLDIICLIWSSESCIRTKENHTKMYSSFYVFQVTAGLLILKTLTCDFAVTCTTGINLLVVCWWHNLLQAYKLTSDVSMCHYCVRGLGETIKQRSPHFSESMNQWAEHDHYIIKSYL